MENFISASSILFVFAGALAGLMAGLLGIGGGLVLVPALIFIFSHTQVIPSGLVMHMAAGTTLASMMFSAFSSVKAHAKRGRVLWPVYRSLAPGIIVGIISGAVLADCLPTQILKTLFGSMLLLIVIKMLIPLGIRKARFPRRWIHRVVSFFIGLKSGLLGIGGGAVIIPYLTYCGVNMRKTAAISSVCSLTVAVVGCLVYCFTGFGEQGLPAYSVGYVYWPAALVIALFSSLFAPIGARLTYALPLRQLKRAFILFLLVTAIHLLI